MAKEMRTRHMLLALAALTLCIAVVGGALYYQTRLQIAREQQHQNAARHVSSLARQIGFQLEDRLKTVRFFSHLPVLGAALAGDPRGLEETAGLLDAICADQGADVCYLMDSNGTSVTSSNRREPTSFVGQNYAFRPYFKQAVTGSPAIYMALGVTSQKRGVYCSYPVYIDADRRQGGQSDGVVVLKYGLGQMEDFFLQFAGGWILLIDPQGVIFAGNRPSYLYKVLWREGENGGRRIGDARQFGAEPLEWAGFSRDGAQVVEVSSGRQYLLHQASIEHLDGWRLVYLHDLQAVNEEVHAAFFRMGGVAVGVFLLLSTVVVFFLSRRIDQEVLRRIRAEEEIRQLNADLEEKVRERTRELAETREELVRSEKLAVLGQLAGSIAHDLRNPLAAISNSSELLRLQSGRDSATPDRLLSIIDAQIRRCVEIINGLLEFARTSRLEIVPCSLREIIRDVLTRTRIPLEISVSLDIPASLPAVPLDANRMQQVFANLFANAVQAMEKNGGRLRIDAAVEGAFCRVAIADTGGGIPVEHLGKVFKPLFSTRTKGFGLGLATVKQIVEGHGGRVVVASESGQGAVFTLYLPLSPVEPLPGGQ